MKHIMTVLLALGLLSLGGCSSTPNKLDTEKNETVSQFKSHQEVSSAFSALESSIPEDGKSSVSRKNVHERGFNPLVTPIEVIDNIEIINKFTDGGNEVAASFGIIPPEAVLTCLKNGKYCTAYRVKLEGISSIERPEGNFGVTKSVLNLEEVHHITTWSFQGIIVFNGDFAVYAQVESSKAPSTTITREKNSFLKKVVRPLVD